MKGGEKMSSKGKCILRKRKEMLHEKLNQIARESEYIIERIQDIQLRAGSIVSDLELESDEREFLLKYPTIMKKLEDWQAQISHMSFDLDVLVCEENLDLSEDSNITSIVPEDRNRKEYEVENAIRADGGVIWTIPCHLQENDILDMRYVSGDTPHDFWLRFYSTKELEEIHSGIQKLFEENKLKPFKSSEMVGSVVCVCNERDYFRGRVINQCTGLPTSYMIVNIDNGSVLKVDKDKMYHLTEELARIQVQAINCCLLGELGDPALWDACVVKLFHKVMEDSSLVVTISSVPRDTCTKIIVKVDVHNELRAQNKIDLSSWITHVVLPVLLQRKTTKSADSLLLLFDSLCTKAELEKSTSAYSPKTQNMEKNSTAKANVDMVTNSNNTAQKKNVQLELLSVEKQFNPFLNMPSPPMPLCAANFMPYQNPSMYFPTRTPPPSPVNHTLFPFVPQIQTPLLGMPNFPNPGSPLPFQQLNQPQFQYSPPVSNRMLAKHQTSPNYLQLPQKGRGHRHQTSLDEKQKQILLPAYTLKNHGETSRQASSITKPVLSTEAKPELPTREESSVEKQVTSSQKVNPRSTESMSGGSLQYPQFKFEVGVRYQAFVVHINDPDDFYVHMACPYTARIEDLDRDMTENYRTCSMKFKNKEQAKQMLYESWCAVFYEDANLWHRGRVTNWNDDTEVTLQVQYVDYGEAREVNLSMIKPLKAEYTQLPICATRCKLAKIHPPQLQDGNSSSSWCSEAIELFKALVVADKLYSIVVTNTSSGILPVLLITDDCTVVNKEFLDLEYAVALSPIEFDPSLPFQHLTEHEDKVCSDNKLVPNVKNPDKITGSSCKVVNGDSLDQGSKDNSVGSCQKVDDQEKLLQNWNPMAEDFYSIENTEYHDDENACYAVTGYVPQDEKRICKFFAERGTCFKGAVCTKEHSVPNPDGWTTDQEAVLQDPFSTLVLPPLGTEVTVVTTTIYEINKFYAHIHWQGRNEELEQETLLSLNKAINHKDSVVKMKKLRGSPAVGQLVLAKFAFEGTANFFRARVVDTCIEANTVQVVYTDYGNTEWVSLKDIREMEPQYLHLPFQAVECYISNVKPLTKKKEALLYLSEMILGKQLVGRITSKSVPASAEIDLWDGDQKIADILIKKGYAQYRELALYLPEDASIIPG